MTALLEVEDLCVQFRSRDAVVRAVDGVSFAIEEGEIVGLVGESGSGKSVTSLALLGLLEKPAGQVSGSIRFAGQELSRASEQELRGVRGNRMAMIFQDPLTSLNPYLRIEEQLAEVLVLHRRMGRAAARERAVEILRAVGIPDPAERVRSYPHELSGGMRQRVCIAMSLLCDPLLLLADEPTTMLDVTIQAQILEILRDLRQERKMAILFITHDLGVARELCDRVLVMYAGRIVEAAPSAELFARPLHPYTEALLQSVPRIDRPKGGSLRSIAGFPPRLGPAPVGECTFAPRCPRVRPACRAGEPALDVVRGGGPSGGPLDVNSGRLRRCVAPVEEMRSAPLSREPAP